MSDLETMLDLEKILWIAGAIVAFVCGLWLYTRLAFKTEKELTQFMICDGCGENIVIPPAHLCSECKSRKSSAL